MDADVAIAGLGCFLLMCVFFLFGGASRAREIDRDINDILKEIEDAKNK